MSVNSIGHILRRLKISRGGITAFNYSSCTPQESSHHHRDLILPLDVKSLSFAPNLQFSNLNSRLKFDLPFPNNWTHQIIETPSRTLNIIEDLPKTRIIPIIEKVRENSNNSIDLPTQSIIEKHAARLIVIRRRKMRRHKLRKLRKRMKFIWRKKKQRRELKKERAFQAELMEQIHVAEAFDAKSYVDSRLKILDHVRLPNKWRGEILPESMIREFLEEKNKRKMMKINRPRITIDSN